MFEISDHIEYLLTQHDCVIVPELGTFIARYRSAVFSSDKQSLLPPARLIGFNPELVHNDGLLAGSLARVKNISFEEACLLIGQDVAEIKKQVTGISGKAMLGALGVLSLNAEGNLLFEPEEEIPFFADAFGMEPVRMLPLAALYKEEEQTVGSAKSRNPDVYYIPVSKRFVKRIAAAVAVIVMLMSISTPVDDVNAPVNYAALVSSGLLETPSSQPDAIDQAVLREEEAVCLPENISTLPESTDNREPVSFSKAEPSVLPQAAVSTDQPKVGSGRRYYIIVASLPTREGALQQQANFERLGIRGTEILDNGSKVRLYIESFSDKRQAEEYLETVRDSSSHLKNAWLLAARNPAN